MATPDETNPVQSGEAGGAGKVAVMATPHDDAAPPTQAVGRWVTVTPLDPALAYPLAAVLAVAAELAREGTDVDRNRAMRLKIAHDDIRRLLTERYPDDPAAPGVGE